MMTVTYSKHDISIAITAAPHVTYTEPILSFQ